MPISRNTIRAALEAISGIDGLFIDENDLVEDIFLLAYAFPDEDDFESAVVSTCRAIRFLIRDTVSISMLKYEFDQWYSYHYQHRIGQGIPASCRILFRRIENGIEVKGFGHRHIPADFYSRMSAGRSHKDAQ